MKQCKKCRAINEDTSKYCTSCGGNEFYIGQTDTIADFSEKPKKKRKTWLWVLGWIVVFPIPLTVLIVNNQKMNMGVKIGIAAMAWTFFVAIGLLGISDTSSEGSPVRGPNEIIDTADSVSVQSETDCFRTHPAKTIAPETFSPDTLASDTAPPEDKASETDQPSVVLKKAMKVKVSHIRKDENHIGDSWSFNTQINGKHVPESIELSVGDTLTFFAEFTESDSVPDVGTASAEYSVTENDLRNGFSVSMDLIVTENGGRNRGQSAVFVVTCRFDA